jgi:hypothetical protein
MAVRWCDGFDSYASTTDLTKKWGYGFGNNNPNLTTPNSLAGFTWSSTAGRTGGGALQLTPTASAGGIQANAGPIPYYNGTNQAVGFACWVKTNNATPNVTIPLLSCIQPTNFWNSYFGINTSGSFGYWGSSAGNLASVRQGTRNVCDGNWHWVEALAWLGTAGSTGGIWIDGIQQTSNADDMNGALANQFCLMGMTNSQTGITTLTIDDWILYDNAPGNVNAANSPMGPQIITTLRPNGDSAVQFSPDSGVTNYSRVNEVNADDDTSYVQDSTIGHQDLYDFGDISFVPSSIKSAILNARIENSGAGTVVNKLISKNNSIQLNGGTVVSPLSYATSQQEFSLDPGANAAWTQSNINSAKFGVRVATIPTLEPGWSATDITSSVITLSQNNTLATATNGNGGVRATQGYAQGGSQKVYLEYIIFDARIGAVGFQTTIAGGVGVAREDFTLTSGTGTNSILINYSGNIYNNSGTGTALFSLLDTYPYNLGVALDVSAQKVWFRQNGGGWNSDVIANQNPANGTGGYSMSSWFTSGHTLYPYLFYSNNNQSAIAINMGVYSFLYPMPSGFTAWDGL